MVMTTGLNWPVLNLRVMEKSLNTDRDGIEEVGIREFLKGGW